MAQKNKLHGIELTGTEEPTLQWQDGATGLHGDEDSVKFYAEGTPVIDLGGAGDSTDLELRGAHNSTFGRSRVMLTGCRGSLDNPQYLLKDDAIGTINAGELMPDDTVRAVGNLRFVADQNHGADAAGSRLDIGLVPNSSDQVKTALSVKVSDTSGNKIHIVGSSSTIYLGSDNLSLELAGKITQVFIDGRVELSSTNSGALSQWYVVKSEYLNETRAVGDLRAERREDWVDNQNEAGKMLIRVTPTDAFQAVPGDPPDLQTVATFQHDTIPVLEVPSGKIKTAIVQIGDNFQMRVSGDGESLVFEKKISGVWTEVAIMPEPET
jgi:hypothetical protein